MYNYGLGRGRLSQAPSWTEEAPPEAFPPDGGSGGTAEESSMEIPTGPVPDAPGSGAMGVLDRLKTPMGLGAIGAMAGFFFSRGKKKRLRGALLGGAAGYGASFFVK